MAAMFYLVEDCDDLQHGTQDKQSAPQRGGHMLYYGNNAQRRRILVSKVMCLATSHVGRGDGKTLKLPSFQNHAPSSRVIRRRSSDLLFVPKKQQIGTCISLCGILCSMTIWVLLSQEEQEVNAAIRLIQGNDNRADSSCFLHLNLNHNRKNASIL